jgi:hypothetical protein
MGHGAAAKNLGGCMAVSIFSLAVTASVTLAQGGPPVGLGAPAGANPKAAIREREVREGRLRSAELEAAENKADQKRLEATIVQVKQDFARIQIVRNQIAHNLVARIPLDYHVISNQTEEIHKRAHRLKAYMLPRALEEKKGQQHVEAFDRGDMVGALVNLCKLIDGFVENPALKNAETVNAQQLEKATNDKTRADSDLVSIVELSSRIQKSAERLNKTRQ